MARKSHDDALGVAGGETIIGAGVTVHGTLNSDADITIDGSLDGTITTAGDLTIGVNGRITADVTATNITILGHLKGNITATGEASIRETGQVEGDIVSGGLAISPGGIFVGRSQMQTVIPLGPEPTKPEPQSETKNL
ncbi:MAG TPA: polymer-forming cytoskeletal protein [Candidatus Saccharimonadia bacterium]|nr:polymer-forming cytoskeletal protein [Candidatus Saccharimonadia bacterium]